MPRRLQTTKCHAKTPCSKKTFSYCKYFWVKQTFSTSAGGWYPLPRRKCYLFLLQMPPGHPQRRIWGIFLSGRRVNPEKYLCSTKKRLPRMRKTLKCGRIYKPSSVLQTGARRHPKKLLSFICCSLPPSNGRATLDCWYTWPCRLQ